jgi:hypothetical protein
MKPSDVRGTDLRNLSNREVIAELFFARRGHWDAIGNKCATQSCIDLARAWYLSPDNPNIASLHKTVFAQLNIKPDYNSIEIDAKPNGLYAIRVNALSSQ